jgi:hypothetical protein
LSLGGASLIYTASHALRREGLKAVRRKKRSALKPEHRKARLHFAEHHLD